jgi:hypothetical protein
MTNYHAQLSVFQFRPMPFPLYLFFPQEHVQALVISPVNTIPNGINKLTENGGSNIQ